MSKRNNRRGPRTTYYPTRNQTSKKLFHSPQAYGELIKIPMTPAMQAISVISLIIQAALTRLHRLSGIYYGHHRGPGKYRLFQQLSLSHSAGGHLAAVPGLSLHLRAVPRKCGVSPNPSSRA